MAEEEKEESKEGEDFVGKPKGKKKLIIIAAAVVVVLLVVVGVFMMGGEKKKTPAEEAEAAMEREEVHLARAELEQFIVNLATTNSYLRTKILLEYDEDALKAASKKGGGGEAEGGGEKKGGEGGGEGGGGAKGLPGLLGERTPMMRDAIITVLGSKKADELLATSGKERVKEELVDAINEAIGAEEPVVVKIYFVDFIIQ